MNVQLSRRAALAMFALVVFSWGFNWPVTKLLVQQVSPLWMVAIRSAVALVVLLALMLAGRSLRLPKRGDWPVVLNVSLLHMSAFAILMAIGLSHVAAGRSVVLGFTTPLWVIPGAVLFLGERVTPRRAAGIALGLAGLGLLFNPLEFDWSDADALLGNGLLLLAAFCWALSILHQRAHRWVATPYEVLFWQVLVATVVVTAAALVVEGVPPHRMGRRPGAAVPLRRRVRRGARLLGDGDGQPQPAGDDHVARHAGDACGRRGERHRRAGRALQPRACGGPRADHRRHRARHHRKRREKTVTCRTREVVSMPARNDNGASPFPESC